MWLPIGHDTVNASIVNRDDYLIKTEEYGDDFSASMGAEGIRDLLSSLTFVLRLRTCGVKWRIQVQKQRSKSLNGLRCLKHLITGIKPQRMILAVLPVLPPDLRPLVPWMAGVLQLLI